MKYLILVSLFIAINVNAASFDCYENHKHIYHGTVDLVAITKEDFILPKNKYDILIKRKSEHNPHCVITEWIS